MELTHFNEQNRARMVDVSAKDITERFAVAYAEVHVNKDTYDLIAEGHIKKGDVLAVSQVAGIMAAKKTPEIIPMCHPINITGVDINFDMDEKEHIIRIYAKARCAGQTGVEMEALCAASLAALTIYDMCKAVQRDIRIEGVRLLEKDGGKSGHFIAKQ